MKEKIYRFMIGRNGADQFSRFLSFAALGVIVVNLFVRSAVLSALCLALLIWSYFRVFSRNIPRRRAENERYLALRYRVTGYFSGLTDRWKQRRDFAFFRCPGCKAMLRVPRGKGKIRVTCRKCGNAFERKT